MLKRLAKLFIGSAVALTMIFPLNTSPVSQAATLHVSYYAHTTAANVPYYYERSGKSKVRGSIVKNKTLRVNKYYKGWYQIIWGKRYVWVNKKYVKKGKYTIPYMTKATAEKILLAAGPSEKGKLSGEGGINGDYYQFNNDYGWSVLVKVTNDGVYGISFNSANYYPPFSNEHNKLRTEKAIRAAARSVFGVIAPASDNLYKQILANGQSQTSTRQLEIGGHKIQMAKYESTLFVKGFQ